MGSGACKWRLQARRGRGWRQPVEVALVAVEVAWRSGVAAVAQRAVRMGQLPQPPLRAPREPIPPAPQSCRLLRRRRRLACANVLRAVD